ncbi:MAG: phospholipid carrier-dependent glycosyltransferase [Pyrinomonadaceae bacterium]|nr:phospholipid carrier-dependent glycosyltransferase [Pyrinomonadaceae bacterium]
MEIENEMNAGKTAQVSLSKRHLIFFLILFALIICAVLRSNIATRSDSFTFDEAYHIGAGAAYVKTGDFRLNPEHPPLVKLWTGVFVADVYQMSPYRVTQDKNDERKFVEEDVYNNNDPELIQSRSRAAMFALNGLLLFLFALAARRVFGDVIALAATAYLAIDPTVAAHLPVVMTDLPVALASATAVLLAVQAFRTWRAVDLIFATLALGLALSTKHSAVITMIAVALIGIVMAIFLAKDAKILLRLRRLGLVAAVLIGAVIVLWSFYLFRFSESPNTSEEQFNRPLTEKISDVKSPIYRAGLNIMAKGRLFPRAYTWGMADTIRAGAEGRVANVFAFGNLYYGKAPLYYFPGVIAAKLPLGLLLLTLIGAVFLIVRRIPQEFIAPLLGVIGLSVLFLIVLAKGSTYAGIRHALPVVPPLYLLASLTIYKVVESKSYLLRGAVVISVIAALVSAIPVMRPWEYYNETFGGAANGYRYFSDEGVDLGQRTKELVEYYNENLKPAGEVPYVDYFAADVEMRSRGLDWVGNNPERDGEKMDTEVRSGTFILGATAFTPKLWGDNKGFREASPIARFGNLFVFRGTFNTPGTKANALYYRAIGKIYTAKPETEEAIMLLSEAVALEPKAFFVALELGNQYLKIGNREEALRAYRIAKENAPVSDDISEMLARQIERIETEPLEQIQPLRNPGIE